MSRPTLRSVGFVALGAGILLLLLGALIVAWQRARHKDPLPEPGPIVEEPPPPPSDSGSRPPSVWTQFRGDDQGRCPSNQAVPLTWSEKVNVVWKTAIPGTGVSSPVVSTDRVWMTAALADGRSLRAIALEKSTGKQLFDQEIIKLTSAPPKHKNNSIASPTPLLEGDRLFMAFGAYGIACLRTTDGQVLWKNTTLKFDDEKMGPGGSPLLAGDFLVVHCDGTDDRFIVALRKQDGTVAWKTPRSNPIAEAIPYRKAFSTPLLHEWNNVQQIISSSSFRLFGYQPQTGQELWSVETTGFCPVPVPLVQSNWVFLCTGFNKAELWGFQFEAAGKAPARVWKTARSAPLVPTPVLVDDHIYMVSDNGIASCVEAATGRMLWNERIGGTYWASLLAARGRIYCFAEDGTTTVLNASTEFKVLAKNQLDGQIMATPAAADNAFFLRTKTHLYRLQAKPAGP